jgi:methylated-DNA-[protein]-cysteine S-methyltransferase
MKNHFAFSTPIAAIEVALTVDGRLKELRFANQSDNSSDGAQFNLNISQLWPRAVRPWAHHLKHYFSDGQPLPALDWNLIDEEGFTPFQKLVYRAICKIPHGETRTYGWVAEQMGKPAATRAVGQALRKNPLPVVIPCHRVVSSFSLGGFMGVSDPMQPELHLKQKLISLEERFRSPLFPFADTGESRIGA